MHVVMFKSDPRAREKPCIRCGYSLRKIDSTHCPECGLSVWMSLNQNDALEWSRPEWLRRMVGGLWLMALAQAPALVAYGLVLMHLVPQMRYERRVEEVVMAYSGSDDPQQVARALAAIPQPRADYALLRTAILLGAAYLILYHVGMFFLVKSERRYPDRLATVRACAWAVCGAAGLVSLMMFAWAIDPDMMSMFAVVVKFVVLVSGLVTWAFLRRLAKRLPHSGLAKTCGWLMLVPALSFLKVFPFFGFFLVARLWWLIDFLPLAYLPLSAVLLAWFATLFRKAAASAEVSWASETAGVGAR